MQNQLMQRTNDLLARTKQFALATIKFCEGLPKDETTRVLSRQLLRSGTSVGANYRAAHRGKSKADFISKMGTVLEEADESAYWIELLFDAGKVEALTPTELHREANELVAIAISSINTARRKLGAASIISREIEGPEGSAFCVLHSAFPSGPRHFNKEQTPLAIWLDTNPRFHGGSFGV